MGQVYFNYLYIKIDIIKKQLCLYSLILYINKQCVESVFNFLKGELYDICAYNIFYYNYVIFLEEK